MTEPVALLSLPRPQRPAWIRVRAPSGENYEQLKGLVHSLALHTVCEEALCPNMDECWGAGTATLMILGDTCTRACRFCAVTTGNPHGHVDTEEPARVANAIARLKLNYVIITSVDRDDLPDGGADIFAETVRQIKAKSPRTLVEILTPDFRGVLENVRTVVESRPDVFGQNIETVRDLRAAQVDLLAIGQYLQPTHLKRHVPLVEYVHPDQFAQYKEDGMKLGFKYVASGPLVRSSYKTWEAALI